MSNDIIALQDIDKTEIANSVVCSIDDIDKHSPPNSILMLLLKILGVSIIT
jgi:hypothetical protein